MERYIIDYVLEIQEKRFELKNLKFEMQADTHEEGQQFISISTCIIDDFVFIFFKTKPVFYGTHNFKMKVKFNFTQVTGTVCKNNMHAFS